MCRRRAEAGILGRVLEILLEEGDVGPFMVQANPVPMVPAFSRPKLAPALSFPRPACM